MHLLYEASVVKELSISSEQIVIGPILWSDGWEFINGKWGSLMQTILRVYISG